MFNVTQLCVSGKLTFYEWSRMSEVLGNNLTQILYNMIILSTYEMPFMCLKLLMLNTCAIVTRLFKVKNLLFMNFICLPTFFLRNISLAHVDWTCLHTFFAKYLLIEMLKEAFASKLHLRKLRKFSEAKEHFNGNKSLLTSYSISTSVGTHKNSVLHRPIKQRPVGTRLKSSKYFICLHCVCKHFEYSWKNGESIVNQGRNQLQLLEKYEKSFWCYDMPFACHILSRRWPIWK